MLCYFINTSLKCIELNCASPTLLSVLSDIGKVITGLKWDPSVCPVGYRLRKLSHDQQKMLLQKCPDLLTTLLTPQSALALLCLLLFRCSASRLPLAHPQGPARGSTTAALHSPPSSLFSTCLTPKPLGLPVGARLSLVHWFQVTE